MTVSSHEKLLQHDTLTAPSLWTSALPRPGNTELLFADPIKTPGCLLTLFFLPPPHVGIQLDKFTAILNQNGHDRL